MRGLRQLTEHSVMENFQPRVMLRPGVTNNRLWNPDRSRLSKRARKDVLEHYDYTCQACGHRALKWMNLHHIADSGDNSPDNLVPLCVACHAVLHVGFNLMHRVVEVWRSDISQLEIVLRTREGVRQGLSLDAIKSQLPLTPGDLPPHSTDYANNLLRRMGKSARAYLDEPLCAVFVNFTRWQIEN